MATFVKVSPVASLLLLAQASVLVLDPWPDLSSLMCLSFVFRYCLIVCLTILFVVCLLILFYT